MLLLAFVSINKSVLSFLISTPITGIHSIIATYGVFRWIFTLFRIISAVIIAILVGIFANLIPSPVTAVQLPIYEETQKVVPSFSVFINHCLNVIFKDMAKPFAFGILLGGLILTIIPQGFEGFVSDNVFLMYLIVLLSTEAQVFRYF